MPLWNGWDLSRSSQVAAPSVHGVMDAPIDLSRWRSSSVWGALRRSPVSLAAAAAFVLIGATTGGLHPGRHQLGSMLLHGARSLDHPLSLLSSLLWAPGLPEHVWGTLALLTLGALAERRLGSARYAFAVLSTHVVAAGTVGLGARLIGGFFPAWTRAFLTTPYGGPTLGVVGAVLVASATLPTLWRRRVRVGALALFTTMVLFYGGTLAILVLVAAVAGLVLGHLTHPSPRAVSPVGSVHEARVLASVVVSATALGPLLATLSPAPAGPFAMLGYLVADVRHPRPDVIAALCRDAPSTAGCAIGQATLHPSVGATLMAVLPALLLLVFADGLRRGRRGAWVGALLTEGSLAGVALADYLLTLTDAGPALPIAYRFDESPVLMLTQLVLPSLVPVTAVVVMLVLRRDLFTVTVPRRSATRLGVRTAAMVAGFAVLYVGLGQLAAGQWTLAPTPWSLLADFPLRLVPAVLTVGVSPDLVPTGPLARTLSDWTGIALWAALAAGVLRSFRSTPAGDDERGRATAMLLEHGGGSLAWMGSWVGNTYWFSSTGRSYVAYRLVRGVALTLADPVGPPCERADTVRQFAAFCESTGAVPCFYSASAELERLCVENGWHSVQIAEETVLPLGSLAFTGKKFQDLRTALNRADREGVHVEWLDYRTAPRTTITQIRAISRDWVAQQSLPEMGFTLGGVDQLDDPHVRCEVVVDDAGLVHAVASWLPILQGGDVIGWTLDLMRRRTGAFAHSSELLIARAALDLQQQGYSILSLSGAPLARAEEHAVTGAPRRRGALDRLLDHVGAHLEPVYGFRSLLKFKAKFTPQYRPMYLIYADAASLPTIGRAVARAYVPHVSPRMLLGLARTIVLGRPPATRPASRRTRLPDSSASTRPATAPPATASTHGRLDPGEHPMADRTRTPAPASPFAPTPDAAGEVSLR